MLRELSVALGAALVSLPAGAAPFELIYTGAFGSGDALGLASAPSPTPFAATTPFTLRASFDSSSPNLVAGLPFPGFAAYAPSSVTLTFGGTTYRVVGAAENPAAGVSVALFDPGNVFIPGRYAVGVIVDPVRDGAGIVGDWSSASPGYSVSSLVPTVWQDYNGAGFSSGVGCATGGVCTVAPLVLSDAAGLVYGLTLGTREEEFSQGAPLHTARLAAVPLPGTLGLTAAAAAMLALVRRPDRRARRR